MAQFMNALADKVHKQEVHAHMQIYMDFLFMYFVSQCIHELSHDFFLEIFYED